MSRSSLDKVESVDELLAVQRSFARIVRRPLNSDDTMRADTETDSLIAPTEVLQPHERLELYAQQYWWRIEASFDEDYSRLRQLLGDRLYVPLRDRYLQTHPSRSFTLRDLGAEFAEFILDPKANQPRENHSERNQFEDLDETIRIMAADCARMEWAIIESFDAAEIPPLSPADLTDPSFPIRVLSLQPHLRLLSCAFPVNRLLTGAVGKESVMLSNTLALANQGLAPGSSAGSTAGSATPLGAAIALPPSATFLVIHRQDHLVYVKPVGEEEFRLLQLFAAGCSLEKFAVAAGESLDRLDEVQSHFTAWTSLGWLG